MALHCIVFHCIFAIEFYIPYISLHFIALYFSVLLKINVIEWHCFALRCIAFQCIDFLYKEYRSLHFFQYLKFYSSSTFFSVDPFPSLSFLLLLPASTNLDTKKIGEKIFEELPNVVLDENGDDKMVK